MFKRFALAAATLTPAYPAISQDVPPPPAFSEAELARGKVADVASGYARDFNVAPAQARERLALQAKAQEWAETLQSSGTTVAELSIEHRPAFKVVVYYLSSSVQSQLTAAAPVELRRYLVFRPAKRNSSAARDRKRQIAARLAQAKVPFGVQYDFGTDRFTVEVPDNQVAQAKELFSSEPDVEVRAGAVAQPAAALYGGHWYKPGAGSTYCTAGWPVRDNYGKEALLTAGHCDPRQAAFTWAPATLTTVSSWDHRNDGYYTRDYAFYQLDPSGTGANTTGRAIYVRNPVTLADGKQNSVPGVVSAYYEVTAPKLVVNGQYICKMGAITGITCGTVVDPAWYGDGYANVPKVTYSAQPHIGKGGDSGGPVFSWSTDGSMVHPTGIMTGVGFKYTYNPSTQQYDKEDCVNSSTTASQNGVCYFVFSTLRNIRGWSPFQVNTVAGYLTP